MENKNGLANDLMTFKTGVSSFFGQLFKGDESYDKIAEYNNPKQSFDNILRITKVILFIAVLLSFCIGVAFHYRLFLPTIKNETFAFLAAVALFIIVEGVSVGLGIAAFKMLFTGQTFKSFLHFLGFTLIIIFVSAIFIFRYDISAYAFTGQVSEIETGSITQEEQGLSRDTKSSYDDDIAATKTTIRKGQSQTWKGKITPDGETIVKQGNKTLQKLLALKEKELDRRGAADSSYITGSRLLIEANRKRLSKYGGIIEYSVFFLTFIFSLFKHLSYKSNKEDIENGDIVIDETGGMSQAQMGFRNFGTGQNATLNTSKTPPIASNKQETGRRLIGFFNKNNIEPDIIENSDSSDKKKLYEEGIDAFRFLIKFAPDNKGIKSYEEGIEGFVFLIDNLKNNSK